MTNRLKSVSNTPVAISAIVYDGFGQRYSKQDPSSPAITYAHDDWTGNLLEENNNGSVTDYVYLDAYSASGSPSLPVATFAWNGKSGNTYCIHSDHLGTPQLATNISETPVWTAFYQPYGTSTPAGSIMQHLRFPGQYADAETGLYHNGFRDYIPGLGRYLESDPVGLLGGVNTYQYVGSNPSKWTDRFGLDQGSSWRDTMLRNPVLRYIGDHPLIDVPLIYNQLSTCVSSGQNCAFLWNWLANMTQGGVMSEPFVATTCGQIVGGQLAPSNSGIVGPEQQVIQAQQRIIPNLANCGNDMTCVFGNIPTVQPNPNPPN